MSAIDHKSATVHYQLGHSHEPKRSTETSWKLDMAIITVRVLQKRQLFKSSAFLLV